MLLSLIYLVTDMTQIFFVVLQMQYRIPMFSQLKPIMLVIFLVVTPAGLAPQTIS
jgi:hypothetical protein